MKKVLLLSMIIVAAGLSSAGQDLGAVDPAVQQQVRSSLTSYYAVKDALVESNAEKASAAAQTLVDALTSVDDGKMSDAQKAQWKKLGTVIRADAVHIHRNKELAHQREHFIKLSNSMYALVFGFKANDQEAYLHYCPMKKGSWLSASKDVKNPYYGGKMLACGSVKATLKKN